MTACMLSIATTWRHCYTLLYFPFCGWHDK